MKDIFKKNWIYILVIVFTIMIFIFIKNSFFNEKIVNIDNKTIDFFNKFHVNYLTNIFKIITIFGDWYMPIAIIVCIFIFVKNKWYFYIISCTYLFAGLKSFITKSIILRERPLTALIKIPRSYSFPSGHTLTSIVFYITLCFMISINAKPNNKTITYTLTSSLILLIAISRVYLGVHYLSDVIGGLILGIECELLVLNIIKNIFIKKLKNS